MKVLNIKRVSVSFLILIISIISVYGQKDYLFPSQNPPAGKNPVNVSQFICIGWDGNAYTGKKGTFYETQEYLDAKNSGDKNAWIKVGRVEGVMFTEDAYNSPNPTWKTVHWDGNTPIANPENLSEGDMGMSWAIQTLATGDMKMTFNVISGYMQPTYGGWVENPDTTTKLGFNGESYKEYDYSSLQEKWAPISWGREYEVVVPKYQSTETGEQLYINPALGVRDQPNWIKEAYLEAINAGHEIGNHTIDAMAIASGLPKSKWPDSLEGFDPYPTKDVDQFGNIVVEDNAVSEKIGWAVCAGNNLSRDGWSGVIALADSMLLGNLQISSSTNTVHGFRAPFLHTNNYLDAYRPINSNLFAALKDNKYKYDCSIYSDYHSDFDGTNAYWPFTLDNGQESIWKQYRSGDNVYIDSLPTELWELPISRVVVPVSLRDQIMTQAKKIDESLPTEFQKGSSFWNSWKNNGIVEGVDVMMFIQWGMTKDQWLETMKYTLDLRLQNNKAPFIYSANTDIYTVIYDKLFLNRDDIMSTYGQALSWNTYRDRIEAMEQFRDYANAAGAKFITHKSLVDSLKSMSSSETFGDSSSYVTTWNFVKNDNLNSTSSMLKGTSLENISLTIDTMTNGQYPSAHFETSELAGTFTNLDHISLTYNSSVPLVILLKTDGDSVWQVTLYNVGKEVNSGRIPMDAFKYSPFAQGTPTPVIPSKITGIIVWPVVDGDKVENVNMSIKDIMLFGPEKYVIDTLPPANVTSLNSTAQTTSSISIAWTPSTSSSVDSVLVAWSSDSIADITDAKASSFVVVPANTTNYKMQGLTDNTKYFIRVFANNFNGYWNSGIGIAARTDIIITDDSISPNDITNLTVTSKTTSSFTISWDKSISTDVDYQLLAWSTGNIGDFENAMSKDHIQLSNTMVQHTIDSLDHSTLYNIKIFAVDTAENKSSGVSIKDTTLVLDEISPENVTNLTVDSVSQNELIVSWVYADVNDVDTVIISWSTEVIGNVEDAKTKSYLNVDPSSSTFKIENLLHNTGYNIKVFVADSLGNWNSGTSTIGTTDENISEDKTPPDPVTGLTATAQSHSEINVSWTSSVSEDAANVLVAWSEDTITDIAKAQEGTSVNLTDSGSSQSYLISALKSSTSYYIKVFVKDTANNWSVGVNAFTTTEVLNTQDTINPEPVTSLIASAMSDTAISLTWTSSTSSDVKSILVAWGEDNIIDESDALTKDHVTLNNDVINYVITGLTAKTFYNIKVFTQDSVGLWSPGAAATAKTDSIPPEEILAGDFNKDEKIDVLDFAYVSDYWTKTIEGKTDSIQELYPYFGDFPLIVVDPDGEFNHRDLSVFTRGCHWFYESRSTVAQSAARTVDNDKCVELKALRSGDQLELILSSKEVDDLMAASFTVFYNSEKLEYSEISGESILGGDVDEAFNFVKEYDNAVQIISTELGSARTSKNSEVLISFKFDNINVGHSEIIIEYELVNRNKEIFKRGTKKIDITNLESDDKLKSIKVAPNPSFVNNMYVANKMKIVSSEIVNNSDGGFYFDLVDFNKSEIVSISVYDLLGNLINELNINSIVDDNMIYWSGYNLKNRPVSSGIYKVILIYNEGTVENKISVQSIGIKE